MSRVKLCGVCACGHVREDVGLELRARREARPCKERQHDAHSAQGSLV